MTEIPVVQRGIVSSILVDIVGPQKVPDWISEKYIQLATDNPVIAEFLSNVNIRFGACGVMIGAVVYELIKSQMEADELEELFSE